MQGNPLSIVLLDGTSRQAKNLDKFMPNDIPRVRLNLSKCESWLGPIRTQTEKHKVCTAQAAALLLHELGDRDVANALEDAVRKVVAMSIAQRTSKKPRPKDTINAVATA